MISLWGATGGLNASLSFQPLLTDAGGGIVNTNLFKGSGSATFTRATTAWTKLSTGLWTSVASGQPRFCYIGRDTTIQTDGGYLSELAATQLTTPTAAIRDMTDAAWAKVGITPLKTATGIDGVVNSATTITASAPAATVLLTLVAASTQRTYSPFVKRRTGTGTITLTNGTATLDITALINTSTYTRVQLPGTDLNPAYGFTIATSGDALDIDFNGYEAGAEASSPIDTAGATRNADVLSYPTSGNIDFTQGTLFAEYYTNWSTAGVSHDLLGVTGGGARGLYTIAANPATTVNQFDTTNNASKSGLLSTFTAIRKRAGSWGVSGQFVTGDGAIPGTSVFDGSFGSGATFFIGCNTGSAAQLSGIIKTVKIYNTQLPTVTLQGITS